MIIITIITIIIIIIISFIISIPITNFIFIYLIKLILFTH
jgi:hypothetical protein